MTKVIIVDTQDKQIGTTGKIHVHKKGILHRAFSIMIFNSKNQILIQQRALHKYHSGGMWANACCSHPSPDIDILTQIHSRLREEMGFDCELKWHFSFIYKAFVDNGLTEYEYDHVFWGQYEKELIINTDEVMDFKWIDISCVINEINLNPDIYSFWFKEIIRHSISNGLIQKRGDKHYLNDNILNHI
jgi:isopentenyl-diphosphate delta-isomerase